MGTHPMESHAWERIEAPLSTTVTSNLWGATLTVTEVAEE